MRSLHSLSRNNTDIKHFLGIYKIKAGGVRTMCARPRLMFHGKQLFAAYMTVNFKICAVLHRKTALYDEYPPAELPVSLRAGGTQCPEYFHKRRHFRPRRLGIYYAEALRSDTFQRNGHNRGMHCRPILNRKKKYALGSHPVKHAYIVKFGRVDEDIAGSFAISARILSTIGLIPCRTMVTRSPARSEIFTLRLPASL